MATRDQQYDVSPKEKQNVLKRAALKESLKSEYMKQITNPQRFSPGEPGYLFDPAIQRYLSMKATRSDYFIPTMPGFIKFAVTFLLPIGGLFLLLHTEKSRFERKCRNGEISYRDRQFKFN